MMPAVGLSQKQWFGVIDGCEVYAASALGTPDNARAREVRESSDCHIRVIPAYGYGYRGGWDWSTHNTTIINNAPAAVPRQRTEKDKQEDSARTALLIGGVVASVAAFAVGYFYNQYTDEAQAVKEARQVHNMGLRQGVPAPLTRLIDRREAIHERNYANSRNKLASSALIFVGGLSAVVGGLAVAPVLITAGYTVLFAGTFFALLNLGLHWSDAERNQKDCQQIISSDVWIAREALSILDSQMQPLGAAAPAARASGVYEDLPPPYEAEA